MNWVWLCSVGLELNVGMLKWECSVVVQGEFDGLDLGVGKQEVDVGVQTWG